MNIVLDARRNDGAAGESDYLSEFEDITGGQKDDLIFGDAGPNEIDGYYGGDRIDGGDGNDILDQRLVPDGDDGDRFYGGPGVDLVTYENRSQRVAVTIGDGANDGTGRERDDVSASVERVTGGYNNDVLVGTDAQEGLIGRAGNDVINPKGGEDFVDAGAGDDIIELRDGSVDRFLTGTGTDTFYPDSFDIRYP